MGLAEWISDLFKKRREGAYKVVLPVVFVACMAAVPCLMAAENWDDHDRSEKYAARDFAQNYLKSIKKNGVLITFGDNDTFPLWYAQEVEGTRTDVRILNYTLSGMYWYVEQLFNKLYESEALPFTLPKEYYGLGKDAYYIMDRSPEYLEVTDVLGLLRDHPDRFTLRDQRNGEEVMYIPTKRFKMTLDIPALIEAGVIPAELADRVNPEIRWEIGKQVLYRHELMMLDIIGTNKFMRDINIMNPGYIKDVFPMVYSYSVQDGMNHKLLPYPRQGERHTANTADYFINGGPNKIVAPVGGTLSEEDTRVRELEWGNLNSDIYVDPISLNMGTVQRQSMMLLASEEFQKGNIDKAKQLLDLAQKFFPAPNFPIDVYAVYIYTGGTRVDVVDLYKQIYGIEKATELWQSAYKYYSEEIAYLSQYKGEKAAGVKGELMNSVQIMSLLRDQAHHTLQNEDLAKQAETLMEPYRNMFQM